MKNCKWFKRILILAMAVVMMLTFTACFSTSSSGSSGSGSGSSNNDYVYTPPVSPYVKMVKDATHSTYGITYGRAFDSFFSNPEWSYFKSTSGEHVVEFEGGFSYSGSPATATIQFVLDLSEGTFTAYHLSIDGVAQSKLMLATLINKVFESY